jgi:hypothetical protein
MQNKKDMKIVQRMGRLEKIIRILDDKNKVPLPDNSIQEFVESVVFPLIGKEYSNIQHSIFCHYSASTWSERRVSYDIIFSILLPWPKGSGKKRCSISEKQEEQAEKLGEKIDKKLPPALRRHIRIVMECGWGWQEKRICLFELKVVDKGIDGFWVMHGSGDAVLAECAKEETAYFIKGQIEGLGRELENTLTK